MKIFSKVIRALEILLELMGVLKRHHDDFTNKKK